MATPQFPQIGANPTNQQIVDYLIQVQEGLQWLLKNIDNKNIKVNSLDAVAIKALSITVDLLAAGSITADKMDVSELSAISANMGTITAGSITTNAEIDIGTDARIGNILYLKETDASGQKGIVFSTVLGNSAEISVLSGDMSIETDGFITLLIGSALGLIVNKVVNASALKSNVITNQANVSVVFSGASTSSVAVADSHDHSIPNGTQLLDADGVTVWTFNSYAGSAGHTHTVT